MIEIRELEFVRGDTFFISRYLTDDEGNKLVLNTETDKLDFTVRENVCSEILIEKHIEDVDVSEDGKYKITLNPKDTEKLEFGTYGYSIKIVVGKDEDNPFVRTLEAGTITLQEYDYSRPNEKV